MFFFIQKVRCIEGHFEQERILWVLIDLKNSEQKQNFVFRTFFAHRLAPLWLRVVQTTLKALYFYVSLDMNVENDIKLSFSATTNACDGRFETFISIPI